MKYNEFYDEVSCYMPIQWMLCGKLNLENF